jgi:hypothetical protein
MTVLNDLSPSGRKCTELHDRYQFAKVCHREPITKSHGLTRRQQHTLIQIFERLLATFTQTENDGRVRKQAKRRGREPRDFVGSTPTSVTHAIPQRNNTASGNGVWRDIQESDGSSPSGII